MGYNLCDCDTSANTLQAARRVWHTLQSYLPSRVLLAICFCHLLSKVVIPVRICVEAIYVVVIVVFIAEIEVVVVAITIAREIVRSVPSRVRNHGIVNP